MKEEDQVIAICEATGWKWEDGRRNLRKQFSDFRSPDGKQRARIWRSGPPGGDPLPNFLNDTDTIHDAVRSLPYEQQPFYMKHLFYVLIAQKGDAGVSDFDKHLASASVCAEAFLKTIGKWVDSE